MIEGFLLRFCDGNKGYQFDTMDETLAKIRHHCYSRKAFTISVFYQNVFYIIFSGQRCNNVTELQVEDSALVDKLDITDTINDDDVCINY